MNQILKAILPALVAVLALTAGAQQPAPAALPDLTNWEKWQLSNTGAYSCYFIHNFNSSASSLNECKPYNADLIASLREKEKKFRAVFGDHEGAYENYLRADMVYFDDESGNYRSEVFLYSIPAKEREDFAALLDTLQTCNDMHNRRDGFFANIYYDRHRDLYTIAFRGTDISWADALADINSNLLGKANSQLDKAIAIATVLSAMPPSVKKRIGLTGHSLGGGLASMVSVLTGLSCDTFNAMGIPDNLLDHYSGEFAKNTGQAKDDVLADIKKNAPAIRAFLTSSDLLAKAQLMGKYISGALSLISAQTALVTAEALGTHIIIDTTESVLSGHKLKSFMPKP